MKVITSIKITLPNLDSMKMFNCQIRGFEKKTGDNISPGDYLCELRYTYVEDSVSDCPVIYYGDLVACDHGTLSELFIEGEKQQGDIFAVVDTEHKHFQVKFVTF